MDAILESLMSLWELFVALPGEVALPALAVFAIVGALKWRGLVTEGNQTRIAVALLSFVTGGAQGANTLDEGLSIAAIAVFASIFHSLYENYIAPGIAKVTAGSSD